VDDRVAELMGIINAATADLVDVIAEVLASGAWEGWGIRSPEHWVTWRCGVSPARARRLVALARRVAELPESAGVFAAGSLSEDQMVEVTRYTPPDRDAQIAELAPEMTVPQLRRVLPSLPWPEPDSDADANAGDLAPEGPEEGPGRREVTFGWRDDGRWWLRALLPPDEGAAVQAALEAARDAEFADRGGALERITWSDALARLAAGDLPRGDRAQVLVHVDADRPETARLHLGPVLPRDLAGLLSCDATVRAVIERGGRAVALGRRRRTVTPQLRVLIEDRDRGCRVPGCSQTRWLHIHHLVGWQNGGATEPANLTAVCPPHHRMIHRGQLVITGNADDPDGLTFTDHRGRPLTPARASPPTGPPAPVNPYRHPSGERLQTWMFWN
jgi:hypothetical protein